MKNIKQIIYIIFIILSMMMHCTISYAEVFYSDDVEKKELLDVVIRTEAGEYIKIERTDNVYGTNIYLKNEYNSFDLIKMNKWISSNDSNASEVRMFSEFISPFSNNEPSIPLCQFINIEGGYLVRSKYPDSGYYYVGDTTNQLHIIDKSFNLINSYSCNLIDDSQIGDASFKEGTYYIKLFTRYSGSREWKYATKTQYFCSTDLMNWTECEGMPKRNGSNWIYIEPGMSILENGYWNSSKGNIYKYKNNKLLNVEYENISISNITVAGGYYIAFLETNQNSENLKLAFSKDGIYFEITEIPNSKYHHLEYVHELIDNTLLLQLKATSRTDKKINYIKCTISNDCINGNNVYVELNDTILAFEQPPIIEDGRTLVPMRFLFEQMGADVDWNAETQTAMATLNNTAVTFAIDDTEATVNNQPTTMEVPAQLVNGKTMVPLRFLSEELGYTVTWDEENRTAIIE